MRGHHKQYIDEVNMQFPNWYVKIGKKKWRTTIPLSFSTLIGYYPISEGRETDLFSCVPNTGYTRFHKASLLHDELRKDPEISRVVADFCFLFEMIDAIKDIYHALKKTSCPQKVINREVFRLCRVASLYMLGVSGLIGTIYLKLDKYF